MNGFVYTMLDGVGLAVKRVIDCNERGCRECLGQLQDAYHKVGQAKDAMHKAEDEAGRKALASQAIQGERMRGPKDPALTERIDEALAIRHEARATTQAGVDILFDRLVEGEGDPEGEKEQLREELTDNEEDIMAEAEEAKERMDERPMNETITWEDK